jgi:hypothetical protein
MDLKPGYTLDLVHYFQAPRVVGLQPPNANFTHGGFLPSLWKQRFGLCLIETMHFFLKPFVPA